MRTLLTSEDIKGIVQSAFKNCTFNMDLIDEDSGERTEIDVTNYLNIKFYNWKERQIEYRTTEYLDFENFIQSLNLSLNKAFGLVEVVDEEVVASQDIDSATKEGKITFLVQADKIKILEYYVAKIRAEYLGNPQKIQNSYGDLIKSYILFGTLIYEQEPIMTQVGECIICSCNFAISYLTSADTYSDYKFELSLDNGETYNELTLTKATLQRIFANNPVVTQNRPDLTGYLATSIASVETFTFFDFEKPLILALNSIFFGNSANYINGVEKSKNDPNISVYLRVTYNGNEYIYKRMLERVEKDITNNDFTITSITLKGWGKN